jgi:hypothetical protein
MQYNIYLHRQQFGGLKMKNESFAPPSATPKRNTKALRGRDGRATSRAPREIPQLDLKFFIIME